MTEVRLIVDETPILVEVETPEIIIEVAGSPGPPGQDSFVPGPPGPTMVSSDPENSATLGTDGFIYVPPVGDTAVDEVFVGPTPPPVPFDGQMWVDTTGEGSGSGGGGGGGGVSDHGALTGLADDDHPQYLTTGRGDLRYEPLGGGGGDEYLTPAELLPGLNISLDKVTTPGSVIISAELVGEEEGPSPATGGIVEDVGGYRIHTFNESATMVFPNDILVDALIVGGGGGAGFNRAGGGGAGGFLVKPGLTIAAGTYSVVVGTGGVVGSNGGNTSAFGHTAIGGGAGGTVPADGNAGGSGGGGSATNNEGNNAGGAGTPGQGFDGGPNYTNDSTGGGGGAGGAGATGIGNTGGIAGVGLQSSYSGAARWYAAGGGGGGRTTGSPGGSGIGGNGGGSGGGQTIPAVNTGSGGGGTFDGGTSTPGAAGVVVVRYLYEPPASPGSMWGRWSGTQAAYDAIVTKDPFVLYVVVP